MTDPFKTWAILRPGILLPVFFLSFGPGCAAQGIWPGAFEMARGGVCTVGTGGTYVTGNPAGLGRLRARVYTAGHTRPFAIGEIGVSSLSGTIPVDPGTFRTTITDSGIRGYRDLSLQLDYGMQAGERLFAGISMRYYNTTIAGDWNYRWTIGWGAGLHYEFSTTTHAGIVVLNPVTIGNHSGYGPLFPAMIAAGLSHLVYENTTMLVELAFRSNAPAQLKLGLEYRLSEGLNLAGGFSSSPATYAFGTGFRREGMGVHLAMAWSALPGLHPAIMFTWHPGR